MLTYCLVIFLGLGSAFYYVTLATVDILTEKIVVIEQEVVKKGIIYSDNTIKDVRKIFTRLYQPQIFDNNTSIVDYLNPVRHERIDKENKFAILTAFLQNACSTNSFITDIFIVDFHEKDIFFRTNIPGRGAHSGYNFFDLDFFGRDEINAEIDIIPTYVPDYMKVIGNNFPVISYSIYLFDKNFIRFDSPLGLAVINVRADFFKNAFVDSFEYKGNIFVIDNKGICLFDSENRQMPGEPFPFGKYAATNLNDLKTNDNHIINKQTSIETGFTIISILDRQVIVEETDAIRQSFITITTICILVSMLISVISATIFSRRIKSLVRNLRDIESGNLDTPISVKANDEFGYLEQSLKTMCLRLDEYIKTVYISELKTKTAELKALQAQINPHFLFNTLESIRITAELNKDTQVAKMIHILGNMLRWTIKASGVFVKLPEELSYTDSYLKLQKFRFADAFDFSIDISDDLKEFYVPKLILQPLVENAIQHGFKKKTENGIIKIEAHLHDNNLVLTVADNGIGMDENKVFDVVKSFDESIDEASINSIGLCNVHQRLSILFGSQYGLGINSKLKEGTTITLTIPQLAKEDMEQYVQSYYRR